jgi:hypothetical protein
MLQSDVAIWTISGWEYNGESRDKGNSITTMKSPDHISASITYTFSNRMLTPTQKNVKNFVQHEGKKKLVAHHHI